MYSTPKNVFLGKGKGHTGNVDDTVPDWRIIKETTVSFIPVNMEHKFEQQIFKKQKNNVMNLLKKERQCVSKAKSTCRALILKRESVRAIMDFSLQGARTNTETLNHNDFYTAHQNREKHPPSQYFLSNPLQPPSASHISNAWVHRQALWRAPASTNKVFNKIWRHGVQSHAKRTWRWGSESGTCSSCQMGGKEWGCTWEKPRRKLLGGIL